MELAPWPSSAVWTLNRTILAVLLSSILATVVLATASRAAMPVAAPFVAICAITIVALAHLTSLDRQLPVFDLGALTILITAVYSAVPLLGFWMAGLHWTELSYLPFILLQPGPAEVGGFAWRHVTYLLSLTAAYLLFRGPIAVRCGPVRALRPTAIAAIALVGVALLAYFRLLQSLYGVSYDPSYSDLGAATASVGALPYLLQQISHNLFAILFVLKLCALVWLLGRWHDLRWRSLLFLWLAYEGVTTVTRMGGRTWFVMLLMAFGLLYQRMVRPLSIARAAILVVLLLGGALVYGAARDLGGGLRTVSATDSSPWATMNEFQALYGISYDLYARKLAGTLGAVPWQIRANDLIMLIPSQILPFAKADPCTGYAPVDGIGVGCVMGVISNAVIGLDWIELVVRGLVLGLVFAVVHRWYARQQAGYWATVFYLCLCLWCYYTFRVSTFYFLYYILYRFLPLLIAVRLAQAAIRNAQRLLAAVGV